MKVSSQAAAVHSCAAPRSTLALCAAQAIALKVRSEGKEYRRQPVKAARGHVLKATTVTAPAAVKRRYEDVDPGTRPDGLVQVSTRLRLSQHGLSPLLVDNAHITTPSHN